jgi:4-hydroxymandelate oxidase
MVPTVPFTTLSDLETAGERALPPGVRESVQGGSEEERTLRANREAFQHLFLLPRVLVDVREVRTGTEFLGRKTPQPFFIAPTAYQTLVHPEGERAMARAAAAEGVLLALSTLSNFSLETVAESAPEGERWFQLYVHRDRRVTEGMVRRAERAHYRALVLTVDVPVLGVRDRQEEAHFQIDATMPLGNLDPELSGHRSGPLTQREHAEDRIDPSLTWEILPWLKARTGLPVLVKGVLSPDDARRAVDAGASGVIVSNHGGRQLDGAPATLQALPAVARALGTDAEVYLDGGVRRGSDILLALALGARGVGLGRPPLWALAAGGMEGARRWAQLLGQEFRNALALTGCRDVQDVNAGLVFPK